MISEDLTNKILQYLLTRPCGEVLELVTRLLVELKEKNGQPIS